jgi:hypothetical protein
MMSRLGLAFAEIQFPLFSIIFYRLLQNPDLYYSELRCGSRDRRAWILYCVDGYRSRVAIDARPAALVGIRDRQRDVMK